nr:abhydrolase domain-containing protein mpah [Quercus suber]
MVDATAQLDLLPHKDMAALSSIRRDIWPSREEAARSFASSKYYQKWDPRVVQKWIQYGLRDLPTEQYPGDPRQLEKSSIPVTLTTTVAQEVYFYFRAIYPEARLLQDDDDLTQDIHPEDVTDLPFSRPESQQIFRRLPEVKPSVLYVFGKTSEVSTPARRKSKLETTGIGVGGSGGVGKGRVSEAVLDTGHLVAFEKPRDCAEVSAAFIADELGRWETEERERDRRWYSLSRRERVEINDPWRHYLGLPAELEKPLRSKSAAKL